jgi:hypothetical protein
MEKVVFQKNFTECLDKNFNGHAKYFDYEFKIFFDLRPSVFEINKCLILELHQASISLTNNLLERLLKLALIYNEVGINPIPIEKWNSVFEEPNIKYGSLNLGSSIEQCKNKLLIDQIEKEILFDTIRETMRNGFSHADASKILKNFPNEMEGFHGSFKNQEELKKIDLKQKNIPVLQSILIDNFAKGNAKRYFDYVFDLIGNIENRIIKNGQQ